MPEPKVIYEDKNFLAVDKPAGLLVHAAPNSKFQIPNSQEPTLVGWLLEHYPEVKTVGDPVKLPDGNYGASDPLRPGMVHRLDKDTSGVMLVAKNQKTFNYLKELFQKHEIKKTYLALVWGTVRPPRGVIDKPISLKSGTTKHTVHKGKMEKEAVTEYGVVKNFQFSIFNFQTSSKSQVPSPELHDFTLLEVYPKTGRTHQIRVHLASIGHPVVGDTLYGHQKGHQKSLNSSAKGGSASGGKSSILNSRLMLHALSIEFSAADGKRIRIEAEPPHQFLEIINNVLGF